MTEFAQPLGDDIAAALLRLEQARLPLTQRDQLVDSLRQLAACARELLGATEIGVSVEPSAFSPPMSSIVRLGSGGEGTNFNLLWATQKLGVLSIVPTPEPSPLLDVVIRVFSETIAECSAAELVHQREQFEARRWLASELHDTVKQVLPAIRMLADRAERELKRDLGQAQSLLALISEAAQQGQEELSLLLGELRGQPVATDLHAELNRILQRMARITPDISVSSRIELPVMPREVAFCVLAIMRNALQNAVQHANARTVEVAVCGTLNGVCVTIADDGNGLATEAALKSPGIGMESMIERTEALGGTVQITSTLGAGTQIKAWLPIVAQESEHGRT